MKSQQITPDVRKAIRQWYQQSGLSQLELGEVAGVKDPSVNAWLNGKAQSIRPANWLRIYPHIAEYLPADFPAPQDDAAAIMTGHHSPVAIGHGNINVADAKTITYHAAQKQELDSVFQALCDKVMTSDALAPEAKIVMYNMIQEVRKEGITNK